jgi:hypothetical protein
MFKVLIPNPADPEGPRRVLDEFDTAEEALVYAQDVLGADEEGKISVLSEDVAEIVLDEDEEEAFLDDLTETDLPFGDLDE